MATEIPAVLEIVGIQVVHDADLVRLAPGDPLPADPQVQARQQEAVEVGVGLLELEGKVRRDLRGGELLEPGRGFREAQAADPSLEEQA